MAKLSRPSLMDVRNIRIYLTLIGNWVVRVTDYDSLKSSLQPQCRRLVKYFAHKLCFLIDHVLHRSITLSLSSRSGPGVPNLTLTVIFWCEPTVNGVSVCMRREHFSEFPSANIINWLKLEQSKNYKVTPMIESLRTTQIAFFRFATPSGFLGGGDEVQKVSVKGFVQGKILWNHLWEHRF